MYIDRGDWTEEHKQLHHSATLLASWWYDSRPAVIWLNTQSLCVLCKVGAASRSFQQEQAEGHETEKHQEINEEERPATAIQPVSQRALFLLRSEPGNSKSVSKRGSALNSNTNKQTHKRSYLAADSRRYILVSFLFSLSAFFLDKADLPLCLCRKTCGGELKQIISNKWISRV